LSINQICPLKKAKSHATASVAPVNNNHSTVESSDSAHSSKSKEDKVKADEANAQKTADVKEDCRQRIEEYKRSIKKTMALSDQLDMRDPQCIAEFAHEIYQSMRDLEPLYQIDNQYLQKKQTEIKDTSRGFLVEWIIDVHRKFRLLPETLYVTVNIIDRYLSITEIKKSQLHLLGVTALLISTKYEEIYPPELKDLLSISENKFKKEEVLKMEN
jgi:hypothetical protein